MHSIQWHTLKTQTNQHWSTTRWSFISNIIFCIRILENFRIKIRKDQERDQEREKAAQNVQERENAARNEMLKHSDFICDLYNIGFISMK